MRLLGTNTPGLVARLLLLAALAATVAACGDNRDGARAESRRYSVEIRRTAYGIPHVLANDYGSLGYGYGYAFAQDNLCVMADRVVTLRGERSTYFGPTADAKDPFADAEQASSNLASDVYYRGVRRSGVVRRLLARPAPLGPTAPLRRMVDGYVAGYNRYLRDTGVAQLPDPTCRGKAWVGPITTLDVWSGIYDVNALDGAAQFRDAIVGARPPAAGAPARAPAATIPAGRPDDTGSNGWALGRDATRARDGMLFANPHRPWAGHARFYQVQLTIPGVLDVAGASVYGTPVVEIGHTRGLAWTHTTSTAQRYTIFQLDLVPGKPTSDRVGGRTVAMSRRTVTVPVRGADGELSTVRRTLYGSRYGPVLATGWTATTAFAIRDVNADNLRSMNEWLAMGTAQHRSAPRRARRLPRHPLHQHARRRCRRNGVLRRRVSRPPRHRRARCTLHRHGRRQGPLPRNVRPRRLEVCLQLGQRPRRRPARHLRAEPRPAADPHGLRGQLQRQPLAHQPRRADHRLPGHLRRHRHRAEAAHSPWARHDRPAPRRQRRPRPTRLHAAHPAGRHARQPQLQRRPRPQRRCCHVPRARRPDRRRRDARRRARRLRHPCSLGRSRRRQQPR
jgi:hypothetical protein